MPTPLDPAALLGHAAVKGAVVLLVALALIGRLPAARQRHFAWHLTFLALLALPLLAHWIPAYQPTLPEAALQLVPQELAVADPAPRRAGGAALDTETAPPPPPTAATPRHSAPLPLMDWLIACWLLGAAVVALRYAHQYARIHLFFRRADAAVTGDWLDDLRGLEEDLGFARRVRLARSDRVDIPVVFGWRHPTIALPADAWSWPADKRRQVLTHELIHLAQGDHLMQIVKQLASALYWFNPLVWRAVRRSALDRECACDDRVVATGIDAQSYAQTLLSTAQGLMAAPRPLDAVPGMARPSELKVRIYSLLAAGGRRGITRGWMASMAVSALALTAGLAVVDPVAGKQSEPTPEHRYGYPPTQAGDGRVELLVQYAGGQGTQPIDLLADGEIALLGVGGGVGHHYTDGHRYYTLPAGDYAFAAQYTADQKVLAQEQVLLEDHRSYIMFVMGRGDDMQIRVVDSEFADAEEGVQKVRFIHMAVEESYDVTVFSAAVADDGSFYSDEQLHVERAQPLGAINHMQFAAAEGLQFLIDSGYDDKPWEAGSYSSGSTWTVALLDRADGLFRYIHWPKKGVALASLQGVPADENLRTFIANYPELIPTLRNEPDLLGKLQAYVESNRR